MIPISWYLILSAVLFMLGVAGFLIKRNIITVFMSIELMLNAVNLSFVAFSYMQHSVTLAPWISAGGFEANFTFYLDPLSMLMTLVVTGVGSLIHIYATAYMAHEDGFYRFFAYLNLFCFFMLTLVLAGNYLLLFVG